MTQFLRIPKTVPLVTIKDPEGKIQYFYTHGHDVPLPGWFSYDDHPHAQHFLDHGLIEFFNPQTGQAPDPDRRWECLSILCSLDLPENVGRPTAAEALRRNGFQFSNATISLAVKMFKDPELAKSIVAESRAAS